MRVIQITNWHRLGGGSDYMVRATTRELERAGHEVLLMGHDSMAFAGIRGKASAFARGAYSSVARQEMRAALRGFKPDVVHVHEVYPHHSPWILKDCHNAGTPVVMTCHDFRLTCPVATHLSHGEVCTKCATGGAHWCAIKNCRDSVPESLAYAVRSGVANAFQLFAQHVDLFITPSEMLRKRIVASRRYDAARFVVIPNMVEPMETSSDPGAGSYIAYAGRIAPEKGIDTLLAAASLTGVPVHIAGGDGVHYTPMSGDNVVWRGHLDAAALKEFYRNARCIVIPSRWQEAFGLVAAEAMMHGVPVVAARIGALPEVVEDGVTGLLFEPGNAWELAQQMMRLWADAGESRKLGTEGRAKAQRLYTPDAYRQKLLAAYKAAGTAAPFFEDALAIPADDRVGAA